MSQDKELFVVPKYNYRKFYKESTILCLEAIGTPFASELLEQIISNDLKLRSPHPSEYTCKNAYFLDAQAWACFGKNEQFSLVSKKDLEQLCIDDFFACEERLISVNELFDPSRVVRHEKWVDEVRQNIHKIIGATPNLMKKGKECRFKFGPGSTTQIRGELVNLVDKVQRQPASTSGARRLFGLLFDGTHYGDLHRNTKLINYNVASFIPKKYNEMRLVCTENCLNVLVQKPIGSELRFRLKRTMYDLDYQHVLHTKTVELASLAEGTSGKLPLVTMDLRKASNSIARNVVKHLFPSCWYSIMDMARSHTTLIDGKQHRLEMFSSMGNGFTFEMESIIFLAVLMTLPHNQILKQGLDGISGHISVFGDDIICHQLDADLLTSRLNYLGFEVNNEKSFTSGPFRESCGADFWEGTDVRPEYLRGNNGKSQKSAEPLFGLANKIRRISIRLFGLPPDSTRFARAYAHAKNRIPDALRIYGPSGSVYLSKSDLFSATESETLGSKTEGRGDRWLHSERFTYQLEGQCKWLWAIKPEVERRFYKRLDSEQLLTYILLAGSSQGSPVRGTILGARKFKCYLGL